MARNNKVIQYKKPFTINIGVVIFMLIFVYLAIQITLFLNSEHLSTYEVTENKISADNLYRGVILRNETVVTTDKAGFINYYVGEGDRVKKNSTIYSLDESGKIYDLLANNDSEYILSNDDMKEVRNCISKYKNNFELSNYQTVYDFKYGLENTVLELTNSNMLASLNKLLSENGSPNTFQVMQTEESGIVSYLKDGYEAVTADTITSELFDETSYERLRLRTSEKKDVGSDIYKIVTGDDWSIIVPLSEAQYVKYQEVKSINVTFLKDKRKVGAGLRTFSKDGNFYGELTLNRYMIQYLSDRFIDIELNENATTGLKIPITSITEQTFYKIPLGYFSQGDNSSSYGITKLNYKENGEITPIFLVAEKYYEDEEYGYILTSVLSAGDTIISSSSESSQSEQMQVTETVTLKGVYNVNKGYPVFRRIEILDENEEYCVVASGLKYGLSQYDNIILNAKYAEENHFIK